MVNQEQKNKEERKMKVRMINKEGCSGDFDTIQKANRILKRGWRDEAEIINHPSGNWLQVTECDEDTYERYYGNI